MTASERDDANRPLVTGGVQDARAAAKLDQVMCTLEGMATLLADTPGDFAVVIHGDRDCLGVVVQGIDHPGTERFFGTMLGETTAVSGQGAERLRACVEAVCREARPRVVFLLGTCLSALLGEDVGAVAERLGRETGVGVLALEGAGMGFVTQAELLDRHACLLFEAAADLEPVAEGSRMQGGLCLLGFDPGPEVHEQMNRLGLEPFRVLDRGASLAAWQCLTEARTIASLDRALYPRLTSALASRQGGEILEVPFPVGGRSTRRFFEALLVARGVGEGAVDLGFPGEDAALEAVASARARFAGCRLGYNLGSKKNLQPRTLALAGLVDLPALEELGFEPVLLVQGDDSPARVEALRATLNDLGCGAPLRIFADTVHFGELCRAEGCELVYASDHLREEVESSGAGFLPMGSLEPGWAGVRINVARVARALGRTP